VLNLLGNEGVEWIGAQQTSSLVEVGNAFVDLIEGRMTDASDGSFMPGSSGAVKG
jgi:hypothetical protein